MNRWAIRKDREKPSWHVFVDGKILVSFDTWEECRAMVTYQVRVRPKVEKASSGRIVQIADIIFFVLGFALGVVSVYYGLWWLLPVPISFIGISIRGFLLQDYYHISTRPRNK